MGALLRISAVVCAVLGLAACGGMEDREGNPVQVGEQYVMTDKGLRPLNADDVKVSVGSEYAMVCGEYLRDQDGGRIRYGSDYVVTERGLKLLSTRFIKGRVTDHSGRPIPYVRVYVAHSDRQTTTEKDGTFKLPLVKGFVRLTFKVPDVPPWCEVPAVENPTVDLENNPEGWEVGTVTLPCTLMGGEEGARQWATVDGRYLDNGDGTVTDTARGLMWEAKAGSSDISWEEARTYCENLQLGGYSDWRLPTREELKTLHETKAACGWHEPTPVRGAMTVWTSERTDSSARVYNLCTGQDRESESLANGFMAGALAVRNK